MRHTAVALAIAEGAHPKAIQVRMGHSSSQVALDRYGHLFPALDELATSLDETFRRAAEERGGVRSITALVRPNRSRADEAVAIPKTTLD